MALQALLRSTAVGKAGVWDVDTTNKRSEPSVALVNMEKALWTT